MTNFCMEFEGATNRNTLDHKKKKRKCGSLNNFFIVGLLAAQTRCEHVVCVCVLPFVVVCFGLQPQCCTLQGIHPK